MYGIDVDDGILGRRSGRWLKVRIGGLLATPGSRLRRALGHDTPPTRH